MKNKILSLFVSLLSVSFVSANIGNMMYGSGYDSYGMMGSGTGLLGVVIYLLVLVNLIFLAILLYKKIWGRK